MNETQFSPNSHQMLSTATHPLVFHAGPILLPGESVTSPTALLIDAGTGTSYPGGIIAGPSVSGTDVLVTIGSLQAGHSYRLIVSFQAAPGKILSNILLIQVPF